MRKSLVSACIPFLPAVIETTLARIGRRQYLGPPKPRVSRSTLRSSAARYGDRFEILNLDTAASIGPQPCASLRSQGSLAAIRPRADLSRRPLSSVFGGGRPYTSSIEMSDVPCHSHGSMVNRSACTFGGARLAFPFNSKRRMGSSGSHAPCKLWRNNALSRCCQQPAEYDRAQTSR